MNSWYESLSKPSWTPAAQTIGTIWSILYPVIFVVYGYAAYLVWQGRAPRSLLVPVALNLIANFAFTPIQFGLKNLPLATVDIVIVLVTIVWSMIALWPHAKVAALALVPYLVWVATATVLQTSITLMNR
ncbi:MAG: tryptophan-rich sensory protein [Actinobacteria bacterium]|nr:MAG: tryptophan-rich sensory protein [Actinomycetota bacterium]